MINIPEIEQKIVPEINKISEMYGLLTRFGDSSVTEEKIPIRFPVFSTIVAGKKMVSRNF